MNLDYFQVSVLAFIQGLTEFLPISSSAHLIFPSALWGWPDQGLSFDVAVHVGTFLAVLYFYRHSVIELIMAWLAHVGKGVKSADATLAWLIVIATIPAALAGVLFQGVVEEYARALPVIAISSVIFGLLLLLSDRFSKHTLSLENLTWRYALLIGFAQALALIPGTSRSGVTITAALFCNLKTQDAAKFSFLLSMPIIFASGVLKGGQLIQAEGLAVDWPQLIYAIALSGLVAFACIHWFLKLLVKVGFLPFVIYRLVLGAVLRPSLLNVSNLQSVALVKSTSDMTEAEQSLAKFLGIAVVSEDDVQSSFTFYLRFLPQGLALFDLSLSSAKPTIVDFYSAQLESRVSDSLSKQNLIKALGTRKNPNPSVLDGMAGFGKDAYLMAMAGCQVHMLEKSKIVYALLQDGLDRLQQQGLDLPELNSLSLQFGDFLQLSPQAGQYDVVYLDPMYQSPNRKSKAKRDIERLQRLLGKEDNEVSLMAQGLALAKRRVIVKRAKNAPLFASKKPDFSYKGSSARFDVYLAV